MTRAPDFYREKALAYFESTIGIDLEPVRQRLGRRLPEGGRVLDAGCGSGRDVVAFWSQGFSVVGIDASEELCALARAHLASIQGPPQPPAEGKASAEIRHASFAEVPSLGLFDGIWACSSLVHLDPAPATEVLLALRKALRPDGVLYVNFKLGDAPFVDAEGRRFVPATEEGAMQLCNQAGLRIVENWVTNSLRTASDRWLNLLAQAG